MKNRIIFATTLALLSFAFASCEREIGLDYPASAPVEREFSALSPSSATKTAIDPQNNNSVSWKKDDIIVWAYYGTQSTYGMHVVEADSKTTHFVASGFEGDVSFHAVYGASIAEHTESTMTISGALPATQDGTDFGSTHVSVAQTKDFSSKNLQFHNLVGYIRFYVSNPAIKTVILSDPTGAAINAEGGNIVVTFNNDGTVKSATYPSSGTSRISIAATGKDGETSADGTYLYVAMLEHQFTSGISFRFFDQNGMLLGTSSTSVPITVARGGIVTIKGPVNEAGKNSTASGATLVDLSAEETANCYIAPETGEQYCFYIRIKGNGSSDDSNLARPSSCRVLWEYCGASRTLSSGSIIKDVRLDGDYVYFTSVSQGSALVAVCDAGGNILWSWHIWVWPGYNRNSNAQVYYRNAGALMDRNLGADSNVVSGYSDYASYGFLYQWGRKDPLPGDSNVGSMYGGNRTSVTTSSGSTGTVAYSIAHPETFISSASTSSYDWLQTSIDDLWISGSKTIYDPCPPGWRVPDQDFWKQASGYETLSLGRSSTSYRYFDFAGIFGDASAIVYPVGGYIEGNTASAALTAFQTKGFCWTAGAQSSSKAVRLGLDYYTPATTTYGKSTRRSAFNVRCQSEKEVQPEDIPLTAVSIRSALTLSVGDKETLNIVKTPSDANEAVSWSSSNTKVATVSASGVVTAVAPGNATITVSAKNCSATCLVTVLASGQAENLSAAGTANCYVVSTRGLKTFDVSHKGSSTKDEDAINTAAIASCEVIWQSYGTDDYPLGDMVVSSTYDSASHTCSFTVFDEFKDGNVIIAALDSDRKVLWSWHIWLCKGYSPNDTKRVYGKTALMDRNLGATSIEPGNVRSLGLLYQWGRKDPLPGASDVEAGQNGPKAIVRAATGFTESEVLKTEETGTVSYAIEHPTAFIYDTQVTGGDWLYTRNDKLWASTKTIYDPCPAGWRVPDGGPNGIFAQLIEASAFTVELPAIGATLGEDDWYPFAGWRSYNSQLKTATLPINVGYRGGYWTCSESGENDGRSYTLNLRPNESAPTFYPSNGTRTDGRSVRCMKEQ